MKPLTIRLRLFVTNAVAVAFVAAVGATGYAAVNMLDDAMDAISANGAAMKDQMSADQVHDALRADVLAALLAGPEAPAADKDAVRHDASEHVALFRKLMASMDTHTLDPAVKRTVDAMRSDVDAYLDSAERMVTLALTDAAAARQAHPAFMARFHTLEKSMEALSNLIESTSDATRSEGDATVVRAHRSIELGALLAAVVTLGAGMLLARSIRRPLDEAILLADRIADGRLDAVAAGAPGDEHTETGRLRLALARMQASLRRIVGEVRTGTDAIATAAGQIAAGNMDLSGRTETQAGALEETAASMEELTATVRQNAENARQADALVRAATEVASKSGDAVGDVVQTMGAIEEAARRIVAIIGVIEGIAFQTNILALNAAVEAARAGEQGRGFAVVAGEVRSLAQRANTAAGEIKGLIDDSVRQVEQGGRQVREAGGTMQAVVDGVARIAAIMGEISAASAEQEAGIGQVNRAVVEIDAATQQNAALVEQASAAASAMQDQAEGLKRLVASFHLDAQSPTDRRLLTA